MYKVWARDVEDEESAAEYGALDVESAAEIHASYGHRAREFYECSWPMVFLVVDPDGKTFAVEVERDLVPEFRGSSPAALADFAPAIHVTENGHGTPMCCDIRLPPAHRDWPAGQHAIAFYKVTEEKLADGACPRCVKAYRSRVNFLASIRAATKAS